MVYTHLSKEERLEFSILRSKGYSLRDIAKSLGRHHSSLSRELKKNASNKIYIAEEANGRAKCRRKQSKYQGMKVVQCPGLRDYVAAKMELGWSPELIAGRWRKDTGNVLKADAIYKYVYSIHGQYLCKYLRYQRYGRRKRFSSSPSSSYIPNRTSIDHRPQEINDRKTFGHFEGDTMGRPMNASRRTLVVLRERLSRKIFAIIVNNVKQTIRGMKNLIQSVPIHSLTLDNGVENFHYQRLGIPTYFCNPYHSWEKGSVEQGIGRIRWYIPKKADLINYTQGQVNRILRTLNDRPMKCLDYQTPNEVFYAQLKSYSLTNWCT